MNTQLICLLRRVINVSSITSSNTKGNELNKGFYLEGFLGIKF